MNGPETYDTLTKLHPMGKLGEVRDVADAVMYLETAELVTGEILHVDGGWHAGS